MKKALLILVAVAAMGAAGALVPGCFLNPFRLDDSAPDRAAAGAIPEGGGETSVAVVGDVLEQLGRAPLAEVVGNDLVRWTSCGIAVSLIGVVCFAFLGSKATGGILFLMGLGMSAFGTALRAYPWTTLVAFAAFGALCLAKSIDAWRTEKARAATAKRLATTEEVLAIEAQVIETVPEGEKIKEGLKNLGPEVVDLVKSVVSPIKTGLAREGKI